MRLGEKYSHGTQLALKYGGHVERLGNKIQTLGKYVGYVAPETGER